MGLDITAYSNIDVVRYSSEYVEAFENVAGIDYGYVNSDFPHAITEGIGENTKFIYFMERGATERHSFRAGSYSGYNEFRRTLCFGITDRDIFNNYDKHRHIPFFEMICFSDCEGVFFGNEVCAKLHNDFVNNIHGYRQHVEEDEWMFQKYDDFMRAFEFGAQNGIVIFR